MSARLRRRRQLRSERENVGGRKVTLERLERREDDDGRGRALARSVGGGRAQGCGGYGAAVVVLGFALRSTLESRRRAVRGDRAVRLAGVNELSVCGADLVNREDLVQRGEDVLACNE